MTNVCMLKKGVEKGVGSLFFIDSQSLCSDEHGVAWKRLESLAKKSRRGYMERLFKLCQIEG